MKFVFKYKRNIDDISIKHLWYCVVDNFSAGQSKPNIWYMSTPEYEGYYIGFWDKEGNPDNIANRRGQAFEDLALAKYYVIHEYMELHAKGIL